MASTNLTNQVDDKTFIIKLVKHMSWPFHLFLISLTWAIVALVK